VIAHLQPSRRGKLGCPQDIGGRALQGRAGMGTHAPPPKPHPHHAPTPTMHPPPPRTVVVMQLQRPHSQRLHQCGHRLVEGGEESQLLGLAAGRGKGAVSGQAEGRGSRGREA
jgi:hypothetical protein